jgi:hypothetical protein
MNRILLIIFLAMAPTIAPAQGISATIQQEARKCAKALLNSDYEGTVAYTHKRVVAGMGGKEAMIASLKRATAEMRSQGISIEDVTIGESHKPQKVGSWLVALVPFRILMTVPGGGLDLDSHLLGISEDDGKKWVFIDVGPLTKAQLAQAFPELAGKIELPAKKTPLFKKNQKA